MLKAPLAYLRPGALSTVGRYYIGMTPNLMKSFLSEDDKHDYLALSLGYVEMAIMFVSLFAEVNV